MESLGIPVVGIGASAGGLDALKLFFAKILPDSGMAYVVVSHRNPQGISLLPDILSKCTVIPVTEAENGVKLEPDHIYISPPSHYLSLRNDGTFHFEDMMPEHRLALPIDYFFRSLAKSQKEKAICVILSGAGSDGTLGIKEIKGECGMVMAQDKSAQFSDMPDSAISSGLVDYVLPPDQMPEQLLSYANRLHLINDQEAKVFIQKQEDTNEIFALLRKHTGNDFTFYKTNTFKRRIERRMNVHNITDLNHYVRYLKENAHEIDLLFKELLIGVTSFFRDPPVFDALENEVFPELLKDKNDGDSVRIWVAGCSTGEEAYSFAILLQEYMEKKRKRFAVQIFATDLDEKAVNHARIGVYSDGIALDLTPVRLQQNFTREDNYFRIKKNIREMVIFATQNLISDPPFTKLDMVSCRNLLIYLDVEMQKKIIPLFHYSLRPSGVMLLGSSETIGTFTELFAPLNARWKIFIAKEISLSLNRITKFMELPRVIDGRSQTHSFKGKAANISELAQNLFLKQCIPPSLIVSEKGDVYFIHGRTGLYLEPSSGPSQTSHNIFDMAREGLQLPLAAIIRKASMKETPLIQRDVKVRSNGYYTNVTLRAKKIAEPEALRGLIWVAFENENSENTSSVFMMETTLDKKRERKLKMMPFKTI